MWRGRNVGGTADNTEKQSRQRGNSIYQKRAQGNQSQPGLSRKFAQVFRYGKKEGRDVIRALHEISLHQRMKQ
jgi:hypothetical protein